MPFSRSTDFRDGRTESCSENLVIKNLIRTQKQFQLERYGVIIDECIVGKHESE